MRLRALAGAALALFCGLSPAAGTEVIRLAVTTSFHNSGLADLLLPAIRRDLGLEAHLLAVGTGQALRLGRAGDVDAVLTHSRAAEEAFVREGHALRRREIMANDFVLLGPAADPAGIAEAGSAKAALARIAGAKAVFVSRGDDSGTHRRELALWRAAGLDPERFGRWYRPVGAGMGAALNTAAGMEAYLLSDRATWLSHGRKRDLALLFAGDPALVNQYAFLAIDPARHPHINSKAAARLETWLTGPRAKALIDTYRIDGQRLFTHNAKGDR